MIKLKELLKEKAWSKTMDYQKLIPIQVANLMNSLNQLQQANALGKTKQVKQRYMQAFKLFKIVKRSVDEL